MVFKRPVHSGEAPQGGNPQPPGAVGVKSLYSASGETIRLAVKRERAGSITGERAIVVADPERSIAIFRKRACNRGRVRGKVLERACPAVPAVQSVYSRRPDTGDPNATIAVFVNAKNVVRAETVTSRIDCLEIPCRRACVGRARRMLLPRGPRGCLQHGNYPLIPPGKQRYSFETPFIAWRFGRHQPEESGVRTAP